jgi:hypothetical protein
MTHRSLGSLCGLLIVSTGAFGCSSSSPPAADGGPLSPTFTNVYQAILEPQCSLHHAAGAADSFLTFETQANAYKTLVNVKASGPACGIVTPAETRVVPGSASTSLLYQKVSEATPPCGSQMPLNANPLSAANQALIEDWINAGAPNN